MQAATGGAVTPAVLNSILTSTHSLRTPGVISPFGDVSAQLSEGNSIYHALNLDLKRRFANNFQFLASLTWAHAIDDSSDLQTLPSRRITLISVPTGPTRFSTNASVMYSALSSLRPGSGVVQTAVCIVSF